MKVTLQISFAAMMVSVIAMNLWAGQHMATWDSWAGFKTNPWAMATLVDAYCSFTMFYVWVAWREKTMAGRVIWFVLVMGLGSIMMGLYVLIALARAEPGPPVWSALFPSNRAAP